MDTAHLLTFIDELEIVQSKGLVSADVPSAPAAYVNKGSVLSFVSNVSQQHRDDVLNSTLLAQLAADAKYNMLDPSQVLDWYGWYTTVLKNVGWVIQDFAFQEYQSSNATLTVSAVVLELLRAVLADDPDSLQLATAALGALQDSGNPNQLTLFDSSSSSAQNATFQISTVNETPDPDGGEGVVAMTLGAFYFSADQVGKKFLWVTYSSSSINFNHAIETVTLNELIYAIARQKVIDKLGNNAFTFIDSLDLG